QNKPVITYQFDEETFRKGQYQVGYFDYHKNPMIHFASTIEDVFEELEKIKKNHFKCGKEEEKAIEEFFTIRDDKNCKRVYDFVKND
ncbi:MAG: CDP-glycerol glycerophosphotransferase family protein, partial [Clostridia bacterium]|nr:CDP-glycerol glycerophosphotransferase family protein [Clostridia bacterium]